jgi:hypothetical protein
VKQKQDPATQVPTPVTVDYESSSSLDFNSSRCNCLLPVGAVNETRRMRVGEGDRIIAAKRGRSEATKDNFVTRGGRQRQPKQSLPATLLNTDTESVPSGSNTHCSCRFLVPQFNTALNFVLPLIQTSPACSLTARRWSAGPRGLAPTPLSQSFY